MKKVLALLLALALVIGSLAACGGGSSSGGNDNAGSGNEGGAGEAGGSGDEGSAPAGEADYSAVDGATVVMAFMNWAGPPAGIERIQNLVSEYTQEKWGINFQLLIMDSATYNQNMTLMLSSGEQVDLFNAITVGYTSCVNKDYCLDLEEDGLIQNYGAGILETLNPAFVDACRINGTLYALPQQRDMASGLMGIAIGAEYLDAIGYDYASMYASEDDEVIYTDLDEITNIFAQLHEAIPDKYVFAPQEATISQGPKVDAIGGDTFGVLLDPENSLVVENLYTSDIFREFVDVFYGWNQAGYVSSDALTDDTAATAQCKAGTVMSYATATKPGIRQQESNLCGRDMIIFQCGDDFLKSSAVATMPWCINSGTENPEAAMTVLNALYTDPYLSNLLCWGEEGTEWQYTEDGHITFADGINAENSEYYNNVNWELPNQFIAEIWEGDSLDIWTRMDAFNNGAVASKALGFSFDNSAVAAEYTALTNVYNQYVKSLFFGFMDPETGIAALNDDLNDAGLEKYMAAKQEALNAWAEANGVQ